MADPAKKKWKEIPLEDICDALDERKLVATLAAAAEKCPHHRKNIHLIKQRCQKLKAALPGPEKR